MYEEALQKTVDYIEANITENISLEDCSKVAGYSMYHLHRLFQLYVGKNVMEYVRERRLQYAMRDISKGMRILDTALLYGYESERGFSRAFLNYHGRTPGSCRGSGYMFLTPIAIHEMILIGGKRMENYLSEVFFETLSDMKVISSVQISQNPEEEVMGFLHQYAKENHLKITGRNFGFDVPVSMDQQEKGLRGYEYWLEVVEPIQSTERVTYKEIKGTRYAVLRITDPFQNPFERIPKGWGRMVEWVKENSFDHIAYGGNRYCLESVQEIDGMQFMDLYSAIE